MPYSDLTLLGTVLECISMAGACGLVLSIAFGFPAFLFEQENFYKWLTVGIVSLLLFASTLAGAISFKNKSLDCLKNHIASGYSVYYNGEETDGTKIDVSKYSVTVNEEAEELYLSDKPARSHRSYIPVVIPRH